MKEKGLTPILYAIHNPTHDPDFRPSSQPKPTRPSEPVQQGPTRASYLFFIFYFLHTPWLLIAPPLRIILFYLPFLMHFKFLLHFFYRFFLEIYWFRVHIYHSFFSI